ncbi:serine/threonine protein kinase [Streptomyces armeniacus]|uniref:Serine/threonine protein kinase n=1 Tax=Streptomyces armeniacus TaxID=83291 RepID=A0A345XJT9_9ACTN|nr:class IV lanthionine synthetase LanL [Streptomyces armeniacus]AXK31905.1 serine/threonine protein kinase [Streptomyces armeniacus]
MGGDPLDHGRRRTDSLAARNAPGDDSAYQDLFARLRDELVPAEGWRTDIRDMWCVVTPPGTGLRPQGWKIHLSATPRSAERALAAASRVLLRERTAFKFAKDPGRLRQLLSARVDRGTGGKFLTVYPGDDAQFVRLLDALHEATYGLEGPAVLSDRRHRPHSLVHYRYGGFGGLPSRLDDEGFYTPVLVAPDGSWAPDERNAWFSPPPWAALPHLPGEAPAAPDTARASADSRAPSSVLLNGRFLVREAIRQTNKGGVYRALDRHEGDRRVVVKEARPHIEAQPDGTDVRDYLRNEHRTLTLLEPLGIAVRAVDLFEYQGHVFLAEEEVPGMTLSAWAREQVQEEPRRSLTPCRVLPTARRLVELVAAVHDKGLIIRDFAPGNVMVTPQETPLLIDTEFVAAADEQVIPVGTPGFRAPEVRAEPGRVPSPSAALDLYGLGATLFYLCTGSTPHLPDDQPGTDRAVPPDTHDTRIRNLVRAVSADSPALAALAPVITGLMREQPERRTPLTEVAERLEALSAEPPAAEAQAAEAQAAETRIAEASEPAPAEAERLLTDGWKELAAALTPDSGHAPWPCPPVSEQRLDPFAVQAGVGGTLEVVRRGALTGQEGAQTLLDTLRAALGWLDRRADREPRQLPGLYFGRAGTYWAMYEAADTLGEEDIRQRSVERAKRLPVLWHEADITHGLAGNGLALLHLWRRTEDEEFRERAERCVTSVLNAPTGQGSRWVEPEKVLATTNPSNTGFAHGLAGIATFLLSAARDLGREDLLDAAVRIGTSLLASAEDDGEGIYWPVADPDGDAATRARISTWWCNGAPGIGTFLIRLWRATGDDRLRAAAHRAAVSTRRQKWLLGHSHCHGLAGNGEFLLDMAALTGEDRYRDWAAEHVTALRRFCALREDRLIVVTESDADLNYSYNLGMAGPIGFLHRFRHGGERWWMTDDFSLPAPGRARDVRTTREPTTER